VGHITPIKVNIAGS